MKVWMRLLYLAMAILLLLTAVPVAFAAQTPEEEDTPEDFVILLDCSMSMGSSDPNNLCLEACKNFVDKLPSQDARVTVVAFGYKDEKNEPFVYSTRFEIKYQNDPRRIHVIASFGALDSQEAKTQYKETMANAINSNRKNTDTYTPIGHALAAAVDLLERNGSADGKACIILVSDGVNSSENEYTLSQDEAMIDPASKLAGEHNWPVYCVELNYNNWDKDEVASAQALLDRICANSGERKVGRVNCKNPEDVYVALQRIFYDFYHGVEPTILPLDLPGTYEFEIPALTSEATVDVFGSTIESVELINVDQGTSIKINKNLETEDFAATAKIEAVVEENYYSSIKLICPDEGSWKVLINGDANATVLVSNTALQEMGLTMVANASTSNAVLTKTDTVEIHAFFSYMDYEEHKTSFYTENPATLRIRCSNGEVIEKTMDTAENGYFYTLTVGDVPTGSGSFEVEVELKHSMFRTGRKVSNAAVFKTQNLPIEVIMKEPLRLQAYVNGIVPRVDLSQIFSNPDKDPVTYTFGCSSDRTKTFEYDAASLEKGYLDIMAGLEPGTYEFEIGAKDPDMKEPAVYSFLVTVENREPVPAADVQVEQLWLDNWSWQTVGAVSAELDLDSYFSDPDGMPLSFTVSATNGEEGEIVTATLSGNKLTLLPVNPGISTVTVTCSDGLSQITASFDTEVVSAKAVYWKENGFFWVLGILIFIVIVLICMTLFFTTKVRGKWAISVTVNHKTASCNPIALTTCGRSCKKRKFPLLDLVQGAKKYLTTGDPMAANNITDYFTRENGADGIMLHGVALGNGFKIKRIPRRNNQISVTHDGRPFTGGTVRSGNVQITLRKTSITGVDEAVIVLSSARRR